MLIVCHVTLGAYSIYPVLDRFLCLQISKTRIYLCRIKTVFIMFFLPKQSIDTFTKINRKSYFFFFQTVCKYLPIGYYNMI